jgi:hypothetical protein
MPEIIGCEGPPYVHTNCCFQLKAAKSRRSSCSGHGSPLRRETVGPRGVRADKLGVQLADYGLTRIYVRLSSFCLPSPSKWVILLAVRATFAFLRALGQVRGDAEFGQLCRPSIIMLCAKLALTSTPEQPVLLDVGGICETNTINY